MNMGIYPIIYDLFNYHFKRNMEGKDHDKIWCTIIVFIWDYDFENTKH